MATTRDEERLALLYADNLKRAGIKASVRLVDAVQYEARRLAYEFDMVQSRSDQSLSPGNEQAFYWSTAAAESQGTRNYMGIKSPAVDAMIAALLVARTRPEVVSAVRALDRVLISGFYVVPAFYVPDHWLARWTRISRPATTSLHGVIPETWWRTP
jgi:peptide/nickel transport system substrate-binding protein